MLHSRVRRSRPRPNLHRSDRRHLPKRLTKRRRVAPGCTVADSHRGRDREHRPVCKYPDRPVLGVAMRG